MQQTTEATKYCKKLVLCSSRSTLYQLSKSEHDFKKFIYWTININAQARDKLQVDGSK